MHHSWQGYPWTGFLQRDLYNIPTSDTESEPEKKSNEVATQEENSDISTTIQNTQDIAAAPSVLESAAVETELLPVSNNDDGGIPESELLQRNHSALEGHLEERTLQKASEHTEVVSIEITRHSFQT